MAHEKHDDTFRVIDRRLFNEAGELRQEIAEQQEREAKPSSPAPSVSPVSPATKAPPKAEAEAPTPAANPIAPSRSFQMLVDLLYNNAAVYLGGYTDPATGRPIVDLESARNVIDMFEALRDKTKGNLAAEDDAMLVEVLGGLKMAFLEVSKAASQAMRQNPTAKPASSPRGRP